MESIQQETLKMVAMADRMGLKLTGHIVGIVTRAKTGKDEIVFDQKNTIDDLLKDAMRDTMHSNVDFALDNLQATQVAQASLGAGLNGKDGLVVMQAPRSITNALGFMASAVHPTAPTGDSPYFRQWQGVYQNLAAAGAETADAADIGQGYTHVGGDTPFESGVTYAFALFTAVVLQENDIITINWKITVG